MLILRSQRQHSSWGWRPVIERAVRSEWYCNACDAGFRDSAAERLNKSLGGIKTPKVDTMKSKLIFIGGEAWTGKSTCAEILFKRLNNSAWLDGDDVWRVNPWSVNDPRLRTSDINMAFVLQTYLQSNFDYVILTSIVLSVPSITEGILQRISGVEYDLVSFTLMCDEQTLTERARERDNNQSPQFTVLEQTKNLPNTIKIDTANRSPEYVVDEMFSIITCTK